MALSDDDLWRVIDAVPGGEELGDGGAWLLSVLRAIEAEVRKQDEGLIRKFAAALEEATPVYTTAKNTPAVRSGHVMSGSVKHYIVPSHVVHILIAEARARLEGKP